MSAIATQSHESSAAIEKSALQGFTYGNTGEADCRQILRDWFPRLHDEQRVLLQMRMMAHGRLWMPQHQLADFFETQHVFVKPVYAAMYFPGTALMYLPAIWLQLPTWLPPVLTSAVCVGVFWRIMAVVDIFLK